MSHPDDWTRLDIDKDTYVLIDEHEPFYDGGAHAHQWWLHLNDTPVAFLHTLLYADREKYRLELADIEVREGYRGQGLTHRIVEIAEKYLTETAYTSGSFTPLGYAALSWLPVLPTFYSGHTEPPGVRYRDTTFVHDWDTTHPAHPL